MKITNELLLERLQYLENKQYSENTIENYFTDMKLFLEYLKHKNQVSTISVMDITLLEIEKWKTVLANTITPRNSIYYAVRPTISQSTIQSKLTALKSFMKYSNLYYDIGLDYRKIETRRIKSDYIECIDDYEYWLLQNHIDEYETYRLNSLRMKLLCNIAYTSWLRLSEILNLTVDEIKSKETKITWKGHKTRRVFFTNSSLNLLDEYLYERSKPIPWTWKVEHSSEYAIISHNSGYDFGNPISKQTVCWTMKKYSDSLGLWKRITVHCLRHSYATKLLESWLNIREIQELLGHCDIQTTQNYCHVLKSSLSKKVNQIFA